MKSKHPILKRLAADPFTDWAIIVVGSAVMALALVAAGISVYLGTEAELSAPPQATFEGSRAPLDVQMLGSVVAGFDSREAATSEIKVGKYTVPQDPSLP